MRLSNIGKMVASAKCTINVYKNGVWGYRLKNGVQKKYKSHRRLSPNLKLDTIVDEFTEHRKKNEIFYVNLFNMKSFLFQFYFSDIRSTGAAIEIDEKKKIKKNSM